MEAKLTEQLLPVKEQAANPAEIKLHVIENNNGTKLIVSNCGAAVQSLFVRDKNGQLADIVLGYDDPKEYLQDDYYLGAVVGRYANRIAGDTISINNSTYKLSARAGGYHLHGGTEGFNKKIFHTSAFRVDGGSGIIFTYTSPHLEEGFPGELKLEVIYTLTDDDAWTIEYKAVSSKTTLVNFTQHTYFNLSGKPASGIGGHELKILSQYYLPVNQMQVPTGRLAAVSQSPFDFTQFKKIDQDIASDNEQLRLSNGYDHSFVLEKHHTGLIKHAAIVREAVSGRKLDVYTTEPAVHFYSGNFLNNIKGKNGELYNKHAGFCLETQHFPDAPNHPHFPSTVLNAGEQFYSKTIFKFSLDNQ